MIALPDKPFGITSNDKVNYTVETNSTLSNLAKIHPWIFSNRGKHSLARKQRAIAKRKKNSRKKNSRKK